MWKSHGKYNNHRQEYDGFQFDSDREVRRYKELRLLEDIKDISDLVADKKKMHWPLIIAGVKISTYTPDFQYMQNGNLVVEDCKPPDLPGKTKGGRKRRSPTKTEAYVMRRKLMLALWNIDIQEV